VLNWTIGQKIAAGFLAVLIQAISVGVYAVWTSAQADDRVSLVASQYLPETELAASLERELLNARIQFIYFITIQKPGSLEKGWARFRNAQRELPKLMTVVNHSDAFAAIRPDAEQLRESVSAYQPVLEQIIEVVQRNQNNGPEFAALLDKWAALGGAMVDSAGRLYQHGTQGTNQWAAQASTQRHTTVLTLGCIAGMLIGLLLSFFVTRDISRKLRRVTRELSGAAHHVTAAASQIASSAQSLSEGASSQAASLQQTAASSEEINSMAHKNAENSKSAAEDMIQASARIEEANLNLQQMVGSMNEINASSGKISKIIRVIDEIAFQTNILALNAAVEAARAGDAGMGFAVVADEVRNLAQRSGQAAKDTAGLIEESIARTHDGKNKLNQVATAIHAITAQSTKVKTLVDGLNIGSQEQARGIQQISKAVAQIEHVTQKTAATAEESTSAAEDLSAQSATLKELVEQLTAMVGESEKVSRYADGLAPARN